MFVRLIKSQYQVTINIWMWTLLIFKFGWHNAFKECYLARCWPGCDGKRWSWSLLMTLCDNPEPGGLPGSLESEVRRNFLVAARPRAILLRALWVSCKLPANYLQIIERRRKQVLGSRNSVNNVKVKMEHRC